MKKYLLSLLFNATHVESNIHHERNQKCPDWVRVLHLEKVRAVLLERIALARTSAFKPLPQGHAMRVLPKADGLNFRPL